MARRSHTATIGQRKTVLQKHFAKRGWDRVLPGFGASYAHNLVPGMTNEGFRVARPVFQPDVFLWRRYVSLYDALRDYRIQRLASELASEEQTREAREMRLHRQELADRLVDALGPNRDNYDGAEKALNEWTESTYRSVGLTPGDEIPTDASPRVRAALQADLWIRPLIAIYRDPKGFFRDVAPTVDPLFRPEGINGRLGQILFKWGYAATLNRDVHAALEAAPTDRLLEIVAEAEGRDCFVEGRPEGRKDSRPRGRRPDVVDTESELYRRSREIERDAGLPRGGLQIAIQERVKKTGEKPDTLKKRIYRRPVSEK